MTSPAVVCNDWLGGLSLMGCKDHPHRTDLSCCKIRRKDGAPLSVADAWAIITKLARESEQMVEALKTAAHRFRRDSVSWEDAAEACESALPNAEISNGGTPATKSNE